MEVGGLAYQYQEPESAEPLALTLLEWHGFDRDTPDNHIWYYRDEAGGQGYEVLPSSALRDIMTLLELPVS